MSDFEYWNPDYYVIKAVSGSKADCMKAFQAETLLFPYQEYGTTITSKTHNQDGDCHIVITRFKTKELCMKHVLYPPHYVRHGGKVL